MRHFQDTMKVFDDKAATGVSKILNVTDFNVISIALHGNSSANLTAKLVGSTSDVCPDFTAAQSEDNSWDYIQMVDLQNGSQINGDTGVAFTGSADDRNLEANVNALKWVAIRITAYTAGQLSAFIAPFSLN